jgi:hypothetical protein
LQSVETNVARGNTNVSRNGLLLPAFATNGRYRHALARSSVFIGLGAHGMAQRQLIAIVDDDALIGETLNDLLDSAGSSGQRPRPLLPAEAGHVGCAARLRR